MGDHEVERSADALRTKRLEIVDDEGEVRAVLGTDEHGITSLALFDRSDRLRASLDASELPEQVSTVSASSTLAESFE